MSQHRTILYFVNKCTIAWINMNIDLYGNKVEKGYSAKVILHTNVDKTKSNWLCSSYLMTILKARS